MCDNQVLYSRPVKSKSSFLHETFHETFEKRFLQYTVSVVRYNKQADYSLENQYD